MAKPESFDWHGYRFEWHAFDMPHGCCEHYEGWRVTRLGKSYGLLDASVTKAKRELSDMLQKQSEELCTEAYQLEKTVRQMSEELKRPWEKIADAASEAWLTSDYTTLAAILQSIDVNTADRQLVYEVLLMYEVLLNGKHCEAVQDDFRKLRSAYFGKYGTDKYLM